MPSNSEQRLPPSYYRVCWHEVSRGFLSCLCLVQALFTPIRFITGDSVYNPKAFLPHAASLRQTFVHCGRSSTAASRRSLGSVSVPVWPTILSDRLPVPALVGRYPTNKLIGPRPLLKQKVETEATFSSSAMRLRYHIGY